MKIPLSKLKKILIENQTELHSVGISHLDVFGSVARGEEHDGSDIDLLIEFKEGFDVDLFDFIAVNQFLEKKLGVKVDLVTRSALKKQMEQQILSEKVRIF